MPGARLFVQVEPHTAGFKIDSLANDTDILPRKVRAEQRPGRRKGLICMHESGSETQREHAEKADVRSSIQPAKPFATTGNVFVNLAHKDFLSDGCVCVPRPHGHSKGAVVAALALDLDLGVQVTLYTDLKPQTLNILPEVWVSGLFSKLWAPSGYRLYYST